jgi:hypothetical protein
MKVVFRFFNLRCLRLAPRMRFRLLAIAVAVRSRLRIEPK